MLYQSVKNFLNMKNKGDKKSYTLYEEQKASP